MPTKRAPGRRASERAHEMRAEQVAGCLARDDADRDGRGAAMSALRAFRSADDAALRVARGNRASGLTSGQSCDLRARARAAPRSSVSPDR